MNTLLESKKSVARSFYTPFTTATHRQNDMVYLFIYLFQDFLCSTYHPMPVEEFKKVMLAIMKSTI